MVGGSCPWPLTSAATGVTAEDAGEVDLEPRSRRRKTPRNFSRFPGAFGSFIAERRWDLLSRKERELITGCLAGSHLTQAHPSAGSQLRGRRDGVHAYS
jgi:hypothetical protein